MPTFLLLWTIPIVGEAHRSDVFGASCGEAELFGGGGGGGGGGRTIHFMQGAIHSVQWGRRGRSFYPKHSSFYIIIKVLLACCTALVNRLCFISMLHTNFQHYTYWYQQSGPYTVQTLLPQPKNPRQNPFRLIMQLANAWGVSVIHTSYISS